MLGFGPLSSAPIAALTGTVPPYVPPYVPSGPGSIDPNYDLRQIYDVLAQGFCFSRGDYDALWTIWAIGGFVPLTEAQVLSVIVPLDGPQPPPLTQIKQLEGYDDAPEWFATWASQPEYIGLAA